MKYYAHRGDRLRYPENTQPAFQSIIDSNVTGTEFDLDLTKDGHLVCIHQETLQLKNDKLEHATRDPNNQWLGNYTLKDLKKIDAGSWFADQYADLKILSFAELLQLNWGEKELLVELKDPYCWTKRNQQFEKELEYAFRKSLAECAATQNIKLLSFNPNILTSLKDLGCPLIYNLWTDSKDFIQERIDYALEHDFTALGLADLMLFSDHKAAELIKHSGLELGVYTVSPAYDEAGFRNWNYQNYSSKMQELPLELIDFMITDFAIEISS